MIITKTPYRISLFGGGSDFPQWYENNLGKVISFAINKYCYLSLRELPEYFEHRYRIVYSKVEEKKSILEISHPAVRVALQKYLPNKFVEVHHFGDLPAKSGVGSSSAFAVGLINAIKNFLGEPVEAYTLAKEAINFEQRDLKENVGSQDQVAATFGGFNSIQFKKNDSFLVNPLNLESRVKEEIESRVCLIFSKVTRFSSDISRKFLDNLSLNSTLMEKNMELTNQAEEILLNNGNLDDIGQLLNENFKLKCEMNPDSINSDLIAVFNLGIKNGALGGKVIGAGGGGFILFWLPKDLKLEFMSKMKKFLPVDTKISNHGSRVILS